MDVALDGGDHDLADRRGAGFGQEGPEDLHAGLHGVGGQEHLGHEEDAGAEVVADHPHRLDEGLVEGPLGRPATTQEELGALGDLVAEPVVEIVVHLGDEVLVTQRVQIDVVVVGHGTHHLAGGIGVTRAYLAPVGAPCVSGRRRSLRYEGGAATEAGRRARILTV